MELTGRTALVTGASGFAGGHLAAHLASVGVQVRALVRGTSRIDHLARERIELWPGDITNLDSLLEAMRGVDVVFHLAAKVGHWGREEDFRRVNVTGTENVLRAAQEACVRRLVHTSTVGVYGLDPAGDTDETCSRVRSESPYCNSKIEAEERVFGSYQRDGLPVTVIRPAEIYGPRSAMTTVGPVLAIRMGWLKLIDNGDGICNHLYISNLVDAFVLAAQAEAGVGQGYIVTDGTACTWREFFGHYARMAGKGQLPTMSMAEALGLAAEDEARAERTGRPPATTRVAIEFLTQRARFSIAKARRELGYEPRLSLVEGMRQTEAWLREQGYLG